MLVAGNDTGDAFGTGPTSGYNLDFLHLFVMFFLFLYKLSANMNNHYYVIILLIFNNIMIYFMTFRIKIYRNMPKILTSFPNKKDKLSQV
jgi:biotin transporter BioY